MSGISGIATNVVNIAGINENILVTVDKKGNVFCINMRTGDLLFKVSKFAQSTPNDNFNKITPTIDENYIYITLPDIGGKAKFFAIDYRKAIEMGNSDPNSSAVNSSVAYISSDSDFSGTSTTNNSLIRIVSAGKSGNIDLRGRIAIVSDKGDKDNLKVYYTNMNDNGKAVKVQDAFEAVDSNTSQKVTASSFTLNGGLASEVSYINGYLYLVDGRGFLHAFSGTEENNLALLNMKSSFANGDDIQDSVQRGSTYKLTANIMNYSGKDTEPIDIVFDINDGTNTSTIKKENVIVPAAGLDMNLEYTVPTDFMGDNFNIRCTVNPVNEDGSHKYDESKYTDNSQILQIKVSKPIDLQVTNIKIGEYYEKSYVSADVTVKNNSEQDVQYIPISVYVGGKKLSSTQVTDTVCIAKNSTLNVPVTIFLDQISPDLNKKTLIKAIVNESSVIQESESENNYQRAYINTYRELPDFSVCDLAKDVQYNINQKVVTTFKVRNNSRNDYNAVDVVFKQYNGASETKTIALGANSEKVLSFDWVTPGNEVTFDAIAEINPKDSSGNRKIAERDDGTNNSMKCNTVIKNVPPPSFVPATTMDIKPVPPGNFITHREWSETRFDHWEYVCVGTRTVSGADGKSYTVGIYSWVARYKTYYFYADLKLTVDKITEIIGNGQENVNPQSMKSGYGVNVNVTSTLTTNYDNLNAITGVQHLYAYFPETNYTTALELDPLSQYGSRTNTWQFKVNSESIYNNRVHFTPVWFPNGQNYIMQFVGTDAQTPAGAMSASTTGSIMIQGSMYDDEKTGSAR